MAEHERDVATAFLVLFAQGDDAHLQEVQTAAAREGLGQRNKLHAKNGRTIRQPGVDVLRLRQQLSRRTCDMMPLGEAIWRNVRA